MKANEYFSEKLSNILFLDIKKEKVMKLFNIYLQEEIYMPIKSSELVSNIKSGKPLEEIPIALFVEGMFYVLGIDEEFRYSSYYKSMIMSIESCIPFIKKLIYNEIKKEAYEEAFIFLKGLVQIEGNEENYDKLLSIAETIRIKDSSFKDEELELIGKAKKAGSSPMPYLYEAIIKRQEGKYEHSLVSINAYLSKGGQKTEDVLEFIHNLNNVLNFENGKELLYTDTDRALKLLIPLLEEYGDNASLYYYIAVGYRLLENCEKAIFYLNEALAIDDALVEVVNELGINYASLGDYDTAIKYLRKAFEVTKSVEICTNLIMCYLNSGKIEQAKNHLDIAKKLDSNDEIVMELDKIINSK